MCLYTSTLDVILNSVEWQPRSEELKDLAFKIFRDIWLKIEKVETSLIVDCFANRGWE